MMLMICCTFFIYQYKVYTFINSSSDCFVVLSDSMEESEKQQLIKKLKNLTFQDVNIEEKENSIYVKFKCPPDKFNFFSKWILEKGEK